MLMCTPYRYGLVYCYVAHIHLNCIESTAKTQKQSKYLLSFYKLMCKNWDDFITFSVMRLKYRIFPIESENDQRLPTIIRRFIYWSFLFVLNVVVCCARILSVCFQHYSELEIMIVTQFCYMYAYISYDSVSFSFCLSSLSLINVK